MSYRIEYLSETTEENSICHAIVSTGRTLADAEAEALAHADEGRKRGATGFQIRHLNSKDEVVAIAEFNDPSHAAP